MSSTRKVIIVAVIILAFLLLMSNGLRASTAAIRSIKTKYKDCSLPRSMRNNNPGNIKLNASNAWLGKVPESENTDYNCTTGEVEQVFEQFRSYEYGVRAMIKLLMNYISNGYDTVEKIIGRYDPPSNSPSSEYVQRVLSDTGFAAGLALNPDKETLRKLVKAMARVEAGQAAITDGQFNTAWQML